MTVALLLAGSLLTSSLAEAGTSRDPFWPVGYEPSRAPAPSQEAAPQALLDLSRLSPAEQAIIKSHLRVGGILEQGRDRVAIINSDVVREGEKINILVHGQTYRFQILSLEPQNIVLEPVKTEKLEQPQEEEETP